MKIAKTSLGSKMYVFSMLFSIGMEFNQFTAWILFAELEKEDNCFEMNKS